MKRQARAKLFQNQLVLNSHSRSLSENARVHRDDLVVEISRRFGFQRTGEDLRSIIETTLQTLVGSGVTCDDEGHFRRADA